MTVQIYTSAALSHTFSNVSIACVTDDGDVNLIYTDANGARHTVTEKSSFAITISKPAEST